VKFFLAWLNQSQSRSSLRLSAVLLAGILLPIALSNASSTAQTDSQTIVDTVRPPLRNQAQFNYIAGPDLSISGLSNALNLSINGGLTDPGGQILGCGGKPLSDYTGFNVGLYSADSTDPTGSELGPVVSLTPTEVPDNPNNSVPLGVAPNTANVNPYAISQTEEGRFSFLLDRNRGQIAPGKDYILVVNPPSNSTQYSQRRIKIQIVKIDQVNNEDVVTYRATALDGLPITTTGSSTFDQKVVLIENANQVGLQLLALRLDSTLCQRNQVRLTKSADRASAAPGDTVIYRLSIRNASDGPLRDFSVSDQLPLGFKFLPKSVRGAVNSQSVPIQVTQSGQSVTFATPSTLNTDSVLTIAYAAELTPDALRGTGKNYANVLSHRVDNNMEVKDGPAVQRVLLTAGLMTNCGTILGRVFEDHNFDGEQQKGEPGIPNAVVYLEDGNRVTTDVDGLFSVKCSLPGYHTGVLDPMSVPGYRLAPNHRFIERNSASRLVHLSPGGLVRMNFAVIPAGKPEDKP
jgi:uncharacterized repeat protein (TIGR01451 family)